METYLDELKEILMRIRRKSTEDKDEEAYKMVTEKEIIEITGPTFGSHKTPNP